MTARRWALWFAAAGLGGAILWTGTLRAQEPAVPEHKGIFDQAEVAKSTDLPKPPDGVEPQARGPVHEAFAELARTGFASGPVITKEPPELIEEMPPADKPAGEDVIWICGYWAWDEERTDFLWVSGIWRVPPPDRQWVPGHWAKVEGGWQWVPGFWQAADDGDVTVVPAPPPNPPTDYTPPPPPTNPHSVYVPGCYVPCSQGYTWRAPCYVEPRPGWIYVPAHYCPCPTGYVFVDGYWDYTLQNRGLLFAPAYIAVEYRTQPSFVYTPCYVVHDQALIGALFVNQSSGYFFGDYFGASYSRMGYSSFIDVRIGSGYDPLFGYYRYENRGSPYWERNFTGLYSQRQLGAFPRPPRTLGQQTALTLGFSTGSTSINLGFVRQSVMLAPVGRVNPNVVHLQHQGQEQILAQHRQAQELRQVGFRRQQAQARLITEAKARPLQGEKLPPPPPQRLALDLPKQPPEKKAVVRQTPPSPLKFQPAEAKVVTSPTPHLTVPHAPIVQPTITKVPTSVPIVKPPVPQVGAFQGPGPGAAVIKQLPINQTPPRKQPPPQQQLPQKKKPPQR